MDILETERIFTGLILLFLCIAILPPYWTIFKKAGFSPWLALLMYLPLVNIVVLYVVAFSRWKFAPQPGLSQQHNPYA